MFQQNKSLDQQNLQEINNLYQEHDRLLGKVPLNPKTDHEHHHKPKFYLYNKFTKKYSFIKIYTVTGESIL